MQSLTLIHLTETLRFVESEDTYSVYQTRNGNRVYLAHGTAARLTDYYALDIPTLWTEYCANQSYFATRDTEVFLDLLRDMVIDPDDIDYVRFCDDCARPNHEDEFTSVNAGYEYVCESCLCNYYSCVYCDEYYRNTTTLLSGSEVCQSDLENYYAWCDECDGYYDPNYDDHDHESDDECGCESPAQRFSVRNDGETPLGNDERVTVSLAAGIISAEGMAQIENYLASCARNIALSENPTTYDQMWAVATGFTDALGTTWQTREGNYTKRLSRYAYKSHGLKLSPEIVSRVGCIARDQSSGVDFDIEVTRDLNMSAADFYHEDSCWWTDYARNSRCALKSNGGFGIRTFNGYGVAGRAWAMPLRATLDGTLVPTFDAMTPDAFVVFNGYGDLEGYAPARILAHMAGMTYRKITFTCSPMYVNNSTGYLVAPEDIADGYTDGALHLSVNTHASLHTNERINANA